MIAMFHLGRREMIEEALVYQRIPTALHLGYVQQLQPANVPRAERSRVIKGPCFANLASHQVSVFRFGSNDPFHLPSLSAQFAIARKQITRRNLPPRMTSLEQEGC